MVTNPTTPSHGALADTPATRRSRPTTRLAPAINHRKPGRIGRDWSDVANLGSSDVS